MIRRPHLPLLTSTVAVEGGAVSRGPARRRYTAANIVIAVVRAVACLEVSSHASLVDRTIRRSVQGHGVVVIEVDTFDDIYGRSGSVLQPLSSSYSPISPLFGQLGPSVQKAGQVPQPYGMCPMSVMKRPCV